MRIIAVTAAILALCVGAEAQIADFTPQTPLIGALLHNDAAGARRLLEQGADPNQGRFVGLSPVLLAVMRQDVELVRLMVDKGADLTVRDRSGSTRADVGGVQRSRRRRHGRRAAETRRRSRSGEQHRRDRADLGPSAGRDARRGRSAEGWGVRHAAGEGGRAESPLAAAAERRPVPAGIGLPVVPSQRAAPDGDRDRAEPWPGDRRAGRARGCRGHRVDAAIGRQRGAGQSRPHPRSAD